MKSRQLEIRVKRVVRWIAFGLFCMVWLLCAPFILAIAAFNIVCSALICNDDETWLSEPVADGLFLPFYVWRNCTRK